ncbi:integrase [Streptomyces sp. NBC_00986]|uniref:integrase n=1 Tax=Streptomyces sp. NBC_00986 TaxID=2903702 RepID=UPI0038664018|nr:integrase [Streptomyces sp. NBC_00986]
MTTAYTELPLVPGPDSPSIESVLVVAGYHGTVNRYGAPSWPMAPLIDNPSAPRHTIHWTEFPDGTREEFRLIAWHMVNRALPDTFLVGKVPSWRTRQSPSAIYQASLAWRHFAHWLDKRGITGLDGCTEEVFHDYGLRLSLQPGVGRSTTGQRLTALTRLWAFDEGCVLPRGIAEPPWNREGQDDYLPAATSLGGENGTEPISPDTMGPLLIWALRVVEDFADDILAAWTENRRLTARVAQAKATPAARAQLKTYFTGLIERGQPIPTHDKPGGRRFALTYIAGINGAPQSQTNAVVASRPGGLGLSQYMLDNPGGCPLAIPVTGLVDGKPWKPVLDFTEALALMRHLGTAAFIVLSYLTGMRPQEVLGLRTGCCPDPESGRYLIHGNVYKTATDENGNHRSAGELRDVPWVAIAPVVSAIRVLERIVGDSSLLFDGTAHDFNSTRSFVGSVTFRSWRSRVEEFAVWASDLAKALGRPYETVPADPNGAIGTGRFRRTLAWHIARRPGGLVALAIQYGHLRTSVSSGYASRSRDGIHQLLDVETARATADTLTTLHTDLADGVGVSGPAARRAIHAASQAPAFAGTIFTVRAARAVLEDTSLAVHDNPHAYLMCVYNREKALCHRLVDRSDAPRLDRCEPTCANVTRTDHHADQLISMAEVLEKQCVDLVPVPLVHRLQARAQRLRDLAEKHHRDRITLPEASA